MAGVTMPSAVTMVPVDQIEVLNHRERNSKDFAEIIENIQSIGLKKPIKVTPRRKPDGTESFLLVCGEGRLKAFQVLGQPSIPALVIEATDEDAFIMSLAENIARRHYRPLELLSSIGWLRDQGYDKNVIAQKTGLAPEYVHGILNLLKHGEERLLIAVHKGQVPLSIALSIVGAGCDDKAIQTALQNAYESGELRGKDLLRARRVFEQRLTLGRSIHREASRKDPKVTSSSLVRTYQKEVERQRLLVRKAEFTQQRLLFVITALRELFADETFTTMLRAEGLETLPKYLSERVNAVGVAA